jgi:O-antigen/teichoic acid export membrane protein
LSQARVLLRNILGDWSGFAVQVLVTFFMTPFVLHTLGDARYGVWLLMMGLTGYYGLLDVGFRSGLTQYLPRYLALRDFDKLNRTASTGFAALLVCGSVVLVACLVLSALAPKFFKVPEELLGDIRLGIVILGVSAAAQLAFAPFSAVFSATQRHDISGAIGIVTRLVQAGLILFVLSRGSGLVGLSIVCSSVSMLDYVVRWYVAHKILPELSISLRKANWGSLWEFTSFGLWNVAIHGSQRVVLYTSALILGWFFPPAAITSFGLAGSVNEYFFSMLRPIGFAFFPALVHLDARGDEREVRAIYIAGTRIMAVISLAGAAIAVAWAAPFIGIWAGPEYLHMAPGVLSEPLFERLAEETTVRQKAKGIELAEILSYTATPVVFYLLVGSSVVRGMQRIGLQFLLATRRHRLCAAIFATEAVSNVLLSIILTRRYGLAGCAIGTLIPALVIQGLVQPYCVHRAMEIRLREYLVGVLVRPVLMALVVGLVVIGLRLAAPIGVWGDWLSVALARPEWVGTKTLGWADLFFRGGLSLSAAAAGAVFIGLRRDERQRFVYGPLAELFRKLSRKKRKSGVSEPAIATAVNEAGDGGA